MDNLIKKSIQYMHTNEDLLSILEGWINNGDLINLRLVAGRDLMIPRSSPKYQEIVDGMEFILGDADIRVEEDMILWRETSFPNRSVPTLTSVSWRPLDSFCGCYGAKVYPIHISKGTKIFYISAFDHLKGFLDDEQEFVLEKGLTYLQDDKLIFEPSKEM